jgi:hypothetical protein
MTEKGRKISEKAKIRYADKRNHPMYGKHLSETHRLKISKARKGKYIGKENPHWRGGFVIVDGYRYVYTPNHPYRTQDGYVAEHRLVFEKILGRFLEPIEIIHHKNHDRLDNSPDNLMFLVNQAEHNKFHLKKRDGLGRFTPIPQT